MILIKKIIIKGTLELLSGLHIGDSKDSVQIGGVDSPVVRRKDNNQPYIPGSSLKGKIRGLIEIALGENGDNTFTNYSSINGKLLERLFGSADFASRILVRDAYLTKDEKDKKNKLVTKGWATKLIESEFTDMPYTEIKFENVINRLDGKAQDPRQIERIPAGAKFDIEFVINILSENQEEDLVKKENDYIELIKAGIELLEADYLGGSGTRGYGQVKIDINWENDKRVIHKLAEDFFKNNDDSKTTENPNENN